MLQFSKNIILEELMPLIVVIKKFIIVIESDRAVLKVKFNFWQLTADNMFCNLDEMIESTTRRG